MQKRLNLWQRLKPEYKKAIKEENKKYSYKMAEIKNELESEQFFTQVSYGTAFYVMQPNKLDFFGDAFNPGVTDE
jgi:TRAP-type C4-dicarboxylate transport system substrate-binding protein